MGYASTNLPEWWVETQNNVKTAFMTLVPFTITTLIHYSTVIKALANPESVSPEKLKQLTKPFFYYQLSMVAAYFSSNMYTSIFSWFLMYFWIILHCNFNSPNPDVEYKFTKFYRWTQIAIFFYWWGMIVGFFFEFGHP